MGIRIPCFVLISLSAAVLSGAAPDREQKKGETKPTADGLVKIDFAPLDQMRSKGTYQIRLVLETNDGVTRFDLAQPFENQRDLGGVLCDMYEYQLGKAGWKVTRKGDEITIISFFDKKNADIGVKKIRVTSEKTFPMEFLPKIAAPENVVVIRDAKSR